MTTCKFCGQQTNDEHPDWFPMTRTGTMGSEHRCVLSNECALRAELRAEREERNCWSADVVAIAKALGMATPVDGGERVIFSSADEMVAEIARREAELREVKAERDAAHTRCWEPLATQRNAEALRADTAEDALRDLRAAVLSVTDMIDNEKRRNGAAYGSPPSRIAEWAAELREAAGK